jgi:hypothetical protein
MASDMNDVPQFHRTVSTGGTAWFGKAVVQGAVMGVAFALAYWSFFWVQKLIQPKPQSEAATLAAQQAEYAEQTKIAKELTARSAAILSSQEEQVKRFNDVLSAWEKQTGLKK